MSEVEKQESQKTVVSFITGLLIGGLLVWVFSSTPEEKKQPEEKSTDTEQVEKTDDTAQSEESKKEEEKTMTSEVVGTGSVAVTDQAAGDAVVLGTLELPTKNGWVVVRDYKDGVSGNILGAARYSVSEGLMPSKVELMRATVKDTTYQVLFYTNEGDKGFGIGEDMPIDNTAVTFKTN